MSKTSEPAVSVLIPVHNGETYLEAALRSIMGQTLREIEIVVVDDASTDASPAILARLAAEDPRIRVLPAPENLGIARALNYGLEHVSAPYVARMDDDDIALPERLALQKRFLDTHPDVVLVGGGTIEMDGEGNLQRARPVPSDPFGVRWRMRFSLPFHHPTFMFRVAKAVHYDPEWSVSEDYDFVARILGQGDGVALPETVLHYRVTEGSISGRTRPLQIEEAGRIATRVQRADLSPAVFEALDPFRRSFYGRKALSESETAALFEGFRRMVSEDLLRVPGHRRWLQRQSAKLLFGALWRSGLDKTAAVKAFARHGRDFLLALVFNRLENDGRLPAPLRAGLRIWPT